MRRRVWCGALKIVGHSYVQGIAGELMRKRKKQVKWGRYCAFTIGLFVIGILGIQMWRLKAKNAEYSARVEDLQAKLEEEERRSSDLADYEVYVNSDAYIEDTAKSKLGMLYDDEIIFREE